MRARRRLPDDGRIVNERTGQVVAAHVAAFRSPARRLLGLIGAPRLAPDQGCWIEPCNGVHSFGMRHPFGVILLNQESRIVKVVPHLGPCRVVLPIRGGRIAIEVATGALSSTDLRAGDRLVFMPRAAAPA